MSVFNELLLTEKLRYSLKTTHKNVISEIMSSRDNPIIILDYCFNFIKKEIFCSIATFSGHNLLFTSHFDYWKKVLKEYEIKNIELISPYIETDETLKGYDWVFVDTQIIDPNEVNVLAKNTIIFGNKSNIKSEFVEKDLPQFKMITIEEKNIVFKIPKTGFTDIYEKEMFKNIKFVDEYLFKNKLLELTIPDKGEIIQEINSNKCTRCKFRISNKFIINNYPYCFGCFIFIGHDKTDVKFINNKYPQLSMLIEYALHNSKNSSIIKIINYAKEHNKKYLFISNSEFDIPDVLWDNAPYPRNLDIDYLILDEVSYIKHLPNFEKMPVIFNFAKTLI